jgi:hypothetical protein
LRAAASGRSSWRAGGRADECTVPVSSWNPTRLLLIRFRARDLGLGAARGGGAILSGAQPPRTAILSPTRAVAFSWHCLVQHWYQNAAELLLFFGVWFCCWEEGLGNAARFSPSETGILGGGPGVAHS